MTYKEWLFSYYLYGNTGWNSACKLRVLFHCQISSVKKKNLWKIVEKIYDWWMVGRKKIILVLEPLWKSTILVLKIVKIFGMIVLEAHLEVNDSCLGNPLRKSKLFVLEVLKKLQELLKNAKIYVWNHFKNSRFLSWKFFRKSTILVQEAFWSEMFVF